MDEKTRRYTQSEKGKRTKARSQKRIRLARYGMTIAQYFELSLKQAGVCAICKRPPKRRALAVDHDHKTSKVRGLLCFRCNKYLVGGHTLQSLQQVLNYFLCPPAEAVLYTPSLPSMSISPDRGTL